MARATFVIGDIQGCFATLLRLLEQLPYRPGRDRLWLTGDLVNRGPASLQVLRWASQLEPQPVVVLGNHDLHLLGLAAGLRRPKRRDTLHELLAAPDREALLGWLRRQPLLYRAPPWLMVHAGLPPGWDGELAARLSHEVEQSLRGDSQTLWSGTAAERWDERLEGADRLATIAALLTRLRCCRADGRACWQFAGPPEQAPAGCRPWFELRRRGSQTVVCGHWSALGLRLRPGLVAVDTGCVWGGSLTAVRLEDRAVFQQPLVDEPPAAG